MNCPRCGAEITRARYCINCGLPLTVVETAQRAAATEPPPAPPRASVLRALLPARMPKGTFWAGLTLMFVGVVFALCTAATTLALLVGSGGGVEGLLVSACGLAVLFVPGLALLLAGRPRKQA